MGLSVAPSHMAPLAFEEVAEVLEDWPDVLEGEESVLDL